MRPFRFGVITYRANSENEWAVKARRAEELGYAILLVPDHFGEQLAAVPALMAAAKATSSLRIGSFVFDNDFRHPAVLAKESATIDVLSRGRFELGLGAGWDRSEYEQVGIPYDSGSVRVSRLEESLSIIKRFFSEDTVSFSGNYYTVNNLPGFPRPVQKPHPPILLGGGGKRMLSIAARQADIVAFAPRVEADGGRLDVADGMATAMQQKLNWVRQAAGDRFSELELNVIVFTVVVTDNRQRVAAELAEELSSAYKASKEQVLEMPHFLIGTVDQICEDLQLRREHYGISYISVFEDSMEAFAPVVARLADKPPVRVDCPPYF